MTPGANPDSYFIRAMGFADSVKLTAHLHIVPRLRACKDLSKFPKHDLGLFPHNVMNAIANKP
jgi:hypothetical protein